MASIKTVLIAGPTASGKSAVALALAQALGAEIVNADSMQVYRELRILSARPSATEETRAPHHLFGHIGVLEPYSVARWLSEAHVALAAIHGRGKTAVVVGGTGLYFKALTQGLADAPTSDPEVRAAARARREAIGTDAFHAELVARDPASMRLAPGDTQRVLRAWEVLIQTGRGLSDWLAAQTRGATEGTAGFVMAMERAALYRRIDRRFDAMMAEGALEEARAFWALTPPADRPATKALGLPQMRAVLEGAMPFETAVEQAKRQTRRYAKRQETWFRHQTPDWVRLEATDPVRALVDKISTRILTS